MKFLVKPVRYKPSPLQINTMFLIKDNWDDWFKYNTMYDLTYVDHSGENKYIGKIKIAEIQMQPDQSRANIPDEFDYLDEAFYSLGQSDYYYENLNKLGQEIRQQVLKSLNDIALDTALFEKVRGLDATLISLMRDITVTTVIGQFNRIANGGARLTPYNFKFISPKDDKSLSAPMELSFDVIPESHPPTNIHVIIGRNGVGKTHLIKNMIRSLIYKETNETTGEFFVGKTKEIPFTNVICVAFSAFDEFSSLLLGCDIDDNLPFINIGLPLYSTHETSPDDENSDSQDDRLSQLANIFVESAFVCIYGAKCKMWESAIRNLESDPIFEAAGILNLKDCKRSEFKETAFYLFKQRLSSGHKIILLTITKLVEQVEEKSLIILDEPEGHLHPPLLSSFIRALSDLLYDRNGVAIIATHSPVVLQEVPKRCVWKIARSGRESVAERLDIESFGENLGALTREVFKYEVTHSGFHKLLKDAAEEYRSYDHVVHHFNGELGMEARAILRAIITDLDIKEQ